MLLPDTTSLKAFGQILLLLCDIFGLSSPQGYSWEFLVGGVPSGSPNPDPIFRPKTVIFHTCFQTWPLKSTPIPRPSLLRLEQPASNKKYFLKSISNPWKSYPIPDQNEQSLYLLSDQMAQPSLWGGTYPYMALTGECPFTPLLGSSQTPGREKDYFCHTSRQQCSCCLSSLIFANNTVESPDYQLSSTTSNNQVNQQLLIQFIEIT